MAKKIIAGLLSLAMVAALATPLSEDVGQIFKIPSFKASAMDVVDSINLDDDSNVIKFQTDISKSNPIVELSGTSFAYTGKAICPFVSFKRSSTAVRDLVVGTEITVSYENNINPGTATVVITGINKYKGTVKKTFNILAPNAPANVTGFQAAATNASAIKLTWNKVSGAQGYIVYKYDNAKKTWVRVAKTTTTSNTYTVNNLNAGTEYKFAVKAYITAGKEIASASYPTVMATTNPATVSGLKTASTSANAIKLTWNKASGANGYIVYRYNTSTKKYGRIAKITTNTYTDKSLNAGTSYKYAVRAYKTVDSKELLSTTYPQLTAYTNLATISGFKAASTSASAVKLTWNKVSGAQGYIVYKYDNAKKTWVRVAKTTTTSNTYTVSKLSAGTSYKFAIKAYKTISGKEIASASYPQLTTSTNPATVNFTISAGSNSAALKWSKVTGATGYKVYYKTSANGKWIGLKTTTGTSFTKSGLTKGKTYYFTVKAYRTVSGKTYNGLYTTKSVKIK
ncbi:MAG: fibronectin type III domain-containing protein [Ruminococcus sp.]|nr:fibronectin type III domain-containing protein [Ruminococcus sp.]